MNAGQGGTHWGWVLTAFFASLGRFLAATRSHGAVFRPRMTPSIVCQLRLHWGAMPQPHIYGFELDPAASITEQTVHERGRCAAFSVLFCFVLLFCLDAFLVSTKSIIKKLTVATVAPSVHMRAC